MPSSLKIKKIILMIWNITTLERRKNLYFSPFPFQSTLFVINLTTYNFIMSEILSGRKLLIAQFAANFNEENWFSPISDVLEKISDEEFNYKPGNDINSIRQLVNHLIFWNERWLFRFKKEPLPPYEKNNDETFFYFDQSEKKEVLIQKLFETLDEWKKELEKSSEEKMFDDRLCRENLSKNDNEPWWETLHNVNIHNSYHLGQIVLLKKLYKASQIKDSNPE